MLRGDNSAATDTDGAMTFSVSSRPGSLLGLLLRGLLEQRFPDVPCDIQTGGWIDANAARVVNQANAHELWIFATAPPPELISQLATGVCSAIGLTARREEIELAVAALTSGEQFFAPELLPATTAGAHVAGLTVREIQVARLVAQGHSNGDIASLLGVSPHTVRTHLQSICRRLGVSSRLKVAARVRELQL